MIERRAFARTREVKSQYRGNQTLVQGGSNLRTGEIESQYKGETEFELTVMGLHWLQWRRKGHIKDSTRRAVCGETARCAFAMLRRHRPVR